MTTALSEKGDISLPQPVREQLHLVPGEDFEIFVEDQDTITLYRVSQPANQGLVDLLVSRPSPFDVPPRESDDTEPPSL
jgi:AbrB family looped-hinge helix DNA binding protein